MQLIIINLSLKHPKLKIYKCLFKNRHYLKLKDIVKSIKLKYVEF